MTDFVENKLPPSELPLQPETGRETARDAASSPERAMAPEKISEVVQPAPVSLPVNAVPSAVDPTVAAVETILSEDLLDQFKSMPPEVKAKFKQKGEETVSKLTVLMGRTAVKAKEILSLIVSWLKLIPGVSKYFLEQESKIKTDKLLELHKRNHGG